MVLAVIWRSPTRLSSIWLGSAIELEPAAEHMPVRHCAKGRLSAVLFGRRRVQQERRWGDSFLLSLARCRVHLTAASAVEAGAVLAMAASGAINCAR